MHPPAMRPAFGPELSNISRVVRRSWVFFFCDVFHFLSLDGDVCRKNHGNELERARDLFYALWIPDLFMKRVEAGACRNTQY